MNEWLNKLEVGDTVILSHGHNRHSLMKIERFTKTQIVLDGISLKFRRDDGYQVGGLAWCMSCLREATTEMVAVIKENNLRSDILFRIDSSEFREFDIDHLERILKAMEG